MQKIWRGLLVVVVLLIASASVAAIDTNPFTPRFFESTSDLDPQFNQTQPSTSADVIIVPREGEQGDSHQIAIGGLQPNESITIRIIQDSSATRVYNTNRNASDNGRVQLDIFTTSDDAPGNYTVEVVNSAGTVIGTGTFIILETSGFDGALNITPQSDTAGSTYTFDISNVRPFLDMEVVVLNEVDERVFVTQVRSTVDGLATVQFTSTARDGGTYTVVVRAGDTQVASGTLIVDGPLVTPETTIIPEEVNPGEDVIVSVTGLEAEEVVTIIVTRSGSAVDTVGEMADVNGNVIFLLSTDNAEAGIYDVRVLSSQGVTLVQTSYMVLGGDVRLVVTPEQAPVNNMFVFAASGLAANETVTIQLIENGIVVITEDITSDATGTAVLLLNSDNGLVPGNFTIRLLRDGAAVAQAEIIVEPVEGLAIGTPTSQPPTEAPAQPTSPPVTSQASISIEPATGAIPTNYNIVASGLEAGSTLTVQIRYQGNVIYSVDGLASNDGTFSTGVVSEASDPIGDYTVELVQNGAVQDSASFSIAASDAQPQPTQQATQLPPQPTQPPISNVTINVIPPVVTSGDTFDIRVDGLPPNSDVTVGINFQNNSVYSTTRSVPSNGSLTVNLQTDGTETPGTYTVTVTQNGTVIATQDFTISGSTVPPTVPPVTPTSPPVVSTIPPAVPTSPPVTGNINIVINPPSGDVGTSHTITVTGLNPNETVQFELLFGDNAVFNSERTADASGTFEIALSSSAEDPSGVYDARVLRNGQLLATAQLTITDTSAVQPQPTQPPTSSGTTSITINPPSGAIGTNHTITVNGLAANSDVTLEVRYNGNAVFSTARSSDATGSVVLNLTSEQGDPEGTYSVVVIQNGTQIASGDFVIGAGGGAVQPEPTQPPVASGAASVSVNPPSGAIGTTHTIAVSGLPANSDVTLEVRYNGNAVFTTARSSDATGSVVLNLTSEQGDPEGTYSVVVIQNGTQIATGDFVVGAGDGAVQPQPTQPPVASAGVTITIDPSSGAIGTTHNITVNGLTANSNVTLEVRYNGNVVFSSSRTADAGGVAILAINSDLGDPEGTYTVVAIQNGVEIATGDFVVGSSSVQPPAPTAPPSATGVGVSVDPPSGAIGTAHIVTITGLEPNETVTLDISYAGTSVFSTTSTADANGTAALTLNSESGDSEGQYTVTVSRNDAVVASATFNIGQVVAPTALPPQTGLSDGTGINENFVAELTTAEPQYFFSFNGEVGDTVSIRMTSDDFDTYLLLQDTSGNLLTSNDDGAGGLNAQIGPYSLPYSGEYVIVATSYSYVNFDEAATGTFNLTVETLDFDIPTIDLGTGSQSAGERLTASTPSVNYTFSGQEGDTVLISLDSPDFDTYLILQDNNGSELIANDDSGGTVNSRIGPYTLPYSGTYTIVATSYSFRNFGEMVTGQFGLRLERVTVSTTTYGTTMSLALNNESSAQILSFEAQAGDVISVVVSGDIDSMLSITDPTGFTVFADDDGGLGFNPEVPRYVIPVSGTYSLLVSSFTPGDIGNVQVTVNRDDVRTLDTDTRTVHLNRKQNTDILTLQGTAGSRVNLNVTLLNGGVGNMTITVRQGEETLMLYQTYGMPEDIVLGFEMVNDGSVSIIVTDQFTSGATLEFSITHSPQ